jgi:hypothetical protein
MPQISANDRNSKSGVRLALEALVSELKASLNQRHISTGCFDGHRGGHARRRGPEQVPDPHPTSAQDRPVGDDDAGRGETGRHVQ